MRGKRKSLKFRVCSPSPELFWLMSTYQSQHDDALSLQFCVLKDKATEFSLGLFTFDFKNAFWSIRSHADSETRCECKQEKGALERVTSSLTPFSVAAWDECARLKCKWNERFSVQRCQRHKSDKHHDKM